MLQTSNQVTPSQQLVEFFLPRPKPEEGITLVMADWVLRKSSLQQEL